MVNLSGENRFWKDSKITAILAVVSALLWGSAIPVVKYRQHKFGILQDDLYSIILFVGLRIFFAGIISVIFFSIINKKILVPSKQAFIPIFIAGMSQTVLQHLFLYLGLIFTSGAKGSILSSTTAIVGVILAHFFMKKDKFSLRKALACIVGFSGIVILNFKNLNLLDMASSLKGDFLILLSAVFAASGSMISKNITVSDDPVIISGWQLLLSGIFASLIGFVGGGKIQPNEWSSWLILSYLIFVSATAYAIWTTLLKYHDFSKINIFKSLIPVMGFIISGIFLRESIFQINIILAIILVSISVFLINSSKKIPGEGVKETIN